MKNQHTDKKGLQNLPQYEPKPELWNRLENELNKDRKPKVLYLRWGVAIAASFTLILAMSFLFKGQYKVADLAVEAKQEQQNLTNNSIEKVGENLDVNVKTGENQAESEMDIVILNHYDSSVPVPINVESEGLGWTDAISGNEFTVDGTMANGYTRTTITTSANAAIIKGESNAYGTYAFPFRDAASGVAAPANSYTLPQANYSVPQSTQGSMGLTYEWTDEIEQYEADGDGVDDYYSLEGEEVTFPFARDLESEKYQAVVTDSIHFNNVSGYYSQEERVNTESYAPLVENEYKSPNKDPLSTFGIDVDNASYTVMRTKINSNQYVPKDAVRIEEFVNYFGYKYPQPTGKDPFSVNMEMASCPWNAEHKMVRIGLKGKDIDFNNLSASNLVFLIDVSGSMSSENKLSLVKKSLKLLVDQMGKKDRIAVVTYAGAAGLAVPSTSCDEKDAIKKKIDKLDAGGSTAGGQGIKLAYKVAMENFLETGNNRVILCTDGDFNVGASSDSDMKDLIIENRNKGVFVTVCGFGMGNYQDSKMETIADNGNGNYFYIDNFKESTKVFERDIRATLFTIAKDVKIQVEFNPKHVKGYRLIGYENRLMPPQDFNDDTKDGGELGAGHTVTALYEIIPAGSSEELSSIKALKYQEPSPKLSSEYGDEVLTIQLRYKHPRGDISTLMESNLSYSSNAFESATSDFRFATGVALFSQQLRQSKFVEKQNFSLARSIISNSMKGSVDEEKTELLHLIDKASTIYYQSTNKD
jgi:Ca-activated chloride channel homolog